MTKNEQIKDFTKFLVDFVNFKQFKNGKDMERQFKSILECRLTDIYLSGVAHGQNTLLKLQEGTIL